jgi:flavin-dependent dehydrogenase
MSDFDVIVVGGGPAGTTAATFCVQHGLQVALFEHAGFPRHKVCGDVINPRCWPVLERLGVAERIRTLPHHKIESALFATADTPAVTIPLPGATVAITRSSFDAALLDHARACGVHVFEEQTVHETTTDRRVVTRSGSFRSIRAIIGADGRHSVTARTAGLVGRPRRGKGHVALQSHFPAPDAVSNDVQLYLFDGGYCGLVRVDAKRANLCIVTDPHGARFHNDCEALFAHTVWRNPRFRELGLRPEPLEPLQSAHPLRAPMNRAAGNGVFLVGDALRVMEPFTGQGIFFALRTGELAAQSICGSQFSEETYGAAVAELYRRRGRTNEWLRRVMYRERSARAIVPIVQRTPRLAHWLADNVLGGEQRFR